MNVSSIERLDKITPCKFTAIHVKNAYQIGNLLECLAPYAPTVYTIHRSGFIEVNAIHLNLILCGNTNIYITKLDYCAGYNVYTSTFAMARANH